MNKRKIIKKVLMCEPKHFEVNYCINPWMKIGSVNKKNAYKQWLKLLEIYERLGIEANLIEQNEDLPDMVFTADQGIFKANEVLLSNFRFQQRKKESEIYQEWFAKQNLKIRKLPDGVSFEGGGDSIWFGNKLLVGVGFRGNIAVIGEIEKVWSDTEIISLELISPYFYHLDTCFFVLNEETVFYYPPAFSEKSQIILKEIVPNLIPIKKKEAFNFAANSTVTDHHVVIQKGNLEILGELGKLGYMGIETDVSEFIKAGGGIHCLTSVLMEE